MMRVLADRFELQATAGKGGMGSVHRALDRVTGNTVAVKLLRAEQVDDVSRFHREALVLSTVQHPHIVRYLTQGTTPEGVHYLVQDWIDGHTLRHHLTSFGITATQTVQMAIVLADALAAAHAKGIIHRDVKPENILLVDGDPEQPMLIDFGVARYAGDSTLLTQTGIMVGTPLYMSPEQARGELALGPQVDVWALGVLMYECLTGRPLFLGHSAMAVRARVLMDEPASISAFCPELPSDVAQFIMRLLQKDPRARLPNAAAVAAGLRALTEVGEGPQRVLGAPVAETTVESVDDNAEKAYLFCASISERFDLSQSIVSTIAEKYNLESHSVNKEGFVLRPTTGGQEGARNAANAAMELSAVQNVAVGLVSAAGDTDNSVYERGAMTLEKAVMGQMFRGVTDGAMSGIRLDRRLARFLREEFDIEEDSEDTFLLAGKRKTG